MKRVTIMFEDEEYDALIQNKESKTWHDYVMTLAEKKKVN